MKKVFKIIGYCILALVVALAGLLLYVKVALPDVGPAPEMKIEYSAANIERGAYLANHVDACMDCHSTRDWTKFSGPLVAGTLGKGGELFERKYGFPGVYYSRNITPTGISRYTDGELYRLITTGVTKEGTALFPVMPYPYYGGMATEDVECIIAYLRTLLPIDNTVQNPVSDFPMNFIINTIPKRGEPGKLPDTADKLGYGAYLVNASACKECHTPAKQGQLIQELAFSGGREFPLPTGGTVRSANLTSSKITGMGNLSVDDFVNKFKAYADSGYTAPEVRKGSFNSIMPWTMYAGMTRSDLVAIYTYLHSLPAKENQVVKFTPPVVE